MDESHGMHVRETRSDPSQQLSGLSHAINLAAALLNKLGQGTSCLFKDDAGHVTLPACVQQSNNMRMRAD
jgi:hypothetical protein